MFTIIFYLPLNLFSHGFNALRGAYSIVLRQSLHFSPIVLLLVVGLSIHAASVSVSLGRELIPPMKQGEFGIRLEAPPGTRLDDTEARAQRIEVVLKHLSDVGRRNMISMFGRGRRGEQTLIRQLPGYPMDGRITLNTSSV